MTVREDIVVRLRLLQAQDVRLLLVEQPFDDPGAGANRIDVPAGDLELWHAAPFSLTGQGGNCGERTMARFTSVGSAWKAFHFPSPGRENERPWFRGHGTRADQAFVTRGGWVTPRVTG